MPIDLHTSIDTYTGVHISDNTSTVPYEQTNTNNTTNTTTEDFILSFEETEDMKILSKKNFLWIFIFRCCTSPSQNGLVN